MNSIHRCIFVPFLTEALENPGYSNLHSFHLFFNRGSFENYTAANVCGLLRSLGDDLCDTGSKLDAGRNCIKRGG